MRKLTHEELLERQMQLMNQPRLPFTVILNDIRSLHNVGSIFRTSDGVGIEKIWICGITGFPPNNQINKTALGAEDRVEWEYCKNPLEVISLYKEKGYEIVALEQLDQSISHDDFKPQAKVCLIIGNEVDGVSEDIVAQCDMAIEIDMIGLKNSLNVAVAFGIAAYSIRVQLLKP